VIRRLVDFYEKHKEKNITTNPSEVSSTNTVSTSTNVIRKSDEPKPRVFYKSKSEIKDIRRWSIDRLVG